MYAKFIVHFFNISLSLQCNIHDREQSGLGGYSTGLSPGRPGFKPTLTKSSPHNHSLYSSPLS